MKHELLKAIKITCLVVAGIGLSGCSGMKWQEEVQLSDGRTVVIERENIQGGEAAKVANTNANKPKERVIRFAHPEGSKQMVEWRSVKESPTTWPEKPLIFDIEAGQPTVFSLVAIPNGCEIYSKYVYKDGTWTEEALPEMFSPRISNLSLKEDMTGLLNLETKRKGNAEIIYRKALKQVGPKSKFCGN